MPVFPHNIVMRLGGIRNNPDYLLASLDAAHRELKQVIQ